MTNTKSVVWFEIYIQDMERATKFYETVFATTLEKLQAPDPNVEMMTFPMQNDNDHGATGALVKMEGVSSGGGGTLVYFASEDCALEAKRITEAGGKIQKEKTSLGKFGAMVLGIDTEGNMFGIHSMK